MTQHLAAYSRTSLEDYGKAHLLIDQSYSIVNQRNIIKNYVADHPELAKLPIVEYIDDGFTGTNFERPRFQEMLAAVKRGEVACIVMKDLSRLGRSYLEVGDYLDRMFPSLNVRFIAVTDCYDSDDFLGITSGMDVAFRNFIYDTYSKDLSVKVRSAMRTRMENGKFVNHTPYGYMKSPTDKHLMIPDPQTAPVVQQIFRAILAGKSTSEVAKSLNAQRIMTPLQYKQHRIKPTCQNRQLLWSHTTVLNILHNLKYTGAMVNHTRESRHLRDKSQRRTSPDEWIITENAHEALISSEEFTAANNLLRNPSAPIKKRPPSNDRVFFCGHCGRKLQKTYGTDAYFSCSTPKYQADCACSQTRYSKTDLEAVLLPIYRMQLDLLDEQAAQHEEANKSLNAHGYIKKMARIEKSISACDTQKLALFEAYHSGNIDLETFVERKTALSDQQTQLRAEYQKAETDYAEKKQEFERLQEESRQIADYLSGQSLPNDKALEKMYEAIDRVIIHSENEIEIRWKFEDLFQNMQRPHPQKQAI